MNPSRRQPALVIVGHLGVPDSVMTHRFAIEAEACAMLFAQKADARSQVIGTGNTKACELYGWAPNVDSHEDRTGWMYGVALNDGRTTISAYAYPMRSCLRTLHVELPRGAVFRLMDWCHHWTEDDGPRVCAFVGSFDAPEDDRAIATLRAGIAALARGDYYGAPRVRPGFRVLMDDECLVANDDMTDYAPALLADAQRRGQFVIPCSSCARPAVRIDAHWPYHWEHNRCREHMARAEQPELADG